MLRPSAALAALLCAPLALAGLVDTCSDITDADKCVAHKNRRAGEPKIRPPGPASDLWTLVLFEIFQAGHARL